jgi:transcriptional regulator with XRE-family HTH domain
VTAWRSSTVQRRRQRLGSELRRLREDAKLTADDVAQALECSHSKISRIESGLVSATPRDVRDMLDLYKVDDELREALTQLARGTRQTGWWHAYRDVPLVPRYVDFEVAAAFIHIYQAVVVPGLLQTEQYARAVIRAARPDLSPKQVMRRLELRMERQKVLTQEERPKVWVVLDEAVLHRRVGGPEGLQQQLHHLLEVVARCDVTLQVLPFKEGEHAGTDGEFTVFGFPEAATSHIVYLEHPTRDFYLRKESETRRYVWLFDLLRDAALPPDESLAFVANLAKELK